jgi:hypothetical protein
MITNMEIGEVVGHLDSNGTAVYGDDYTTTGQWKSKPISGIARGT